MSDTQTQIENRPPSVASLFLERVGRTPDAEAYRYPVRRLRHRTGRLEVAELGAGRRAGLRDRRRPPRPGLASEERVALASSTRVEWILADLGVMCAGAAATAVYPRPTPTSRRTSSRTPQPKASSPRTPPNWPRPSSTGRLPHLRHAILVDACGGTPPAEGLASALAELEARGSRVPPEAPRGGRRRRSRAITSTQLATLIYTSGTTGRPKGVRLAHD
ncbi:long-chain fatty acid--CoA ligase [Streptomyces tanashiensis]